MVRLGSVSHRLHVCGIRRAAVPYPTELHLVGYDDYADIPPRKGPDPALCRVGGHGHRTARSVSGDAGEPDATEERKRYEILGPSLLGCGRPASRNLLGDE